MVFEKYYRPGSILKVSTRVMMSLSYVYGVDGLQWENKKETEEKLVDFFFTLTKYGREDV